ncbi:MAG TPA: extracellular solute-binding protein, partial [Patescibacteria group bacterium]|nr:extracellular solute-binding protein [Patescibacteria group bacterium]
SLGLVVFVGVLLSGCGFKETATETYKVKLEVWDVFDDNDVYKEIFAEYKKINPYVSEITYRKFSPETYKEDLLNALAAGKGPDIFMIRNAWRASFEDKIAVAPEYFTEKQYRDALVDVAADDFIKEGKIYGVPLSVDSLGLYYNKDLFNAVGITAPPATWEELLVDIKKLNRLDAFGNFSQSAIALGTAYNINRSTDILTVLALQMGAGQSDQGSGNIFSSAVSQRAIDFYTQFSRIGSGAYSWNPRLHYSIDAFYEGTLGMMINYSWHTATIKQKNAKMNFGVAPLPQFANTAPVNFVNYWGFVVAKNKMTAETPVAKDAPPVNISKQNLLRVHEAWQLLQYMALPHARNIVTLRNGLTGATKDFTLPFDPTKKYLEKAARPAARRDLVEWQKNSILLEPFALGNLVAKNWHQGNPEGVETILAEMINVVNTGEKSVSQALNTATARINTLSR